MPAQRQESNIGSAWLKEQFLNNYTNWIHEVCNYLKDQLPFLSQDSEIQPLLEYVKPAQVWLIKEETLTWDNKNGWHNRKKNAPQVGASLYSKKSNNAKILKAYLQKWTTAW
jgi:hypothetical protein